MVVATLDLAVPDGATNLGADVVVALGALLLGPVMAEGRVL